MLHSCWRVLRNRIDMLIVLKDEDSGATCMPHSCFFAPAHEETRLVFAALVPCSGILRLAKATPYPRRSHWCSAGFTSRMPYGRGPGQRTQPVWQQIKAVPMLIVPNILYPKQIPGLLPSRWRATGVPLRPETPEFPHPEESDGEKL